MSRSQYGQCSWPFQGYSAFLCVSCLHKLAQNIYSMFHQTRLCIDTRKFHYQLSTPTIWIRIEPFCCTVVHVNFAWKQHVQTMTISLKTIFSIHIFQENGDGTYGNAMCVTKLSYLVLSFLYLWDTPRIYWSP